VLSKEERILGWYKIPKSSRILLIATTLVVIFLTPNLAEGYESTWNRIEIDSTDDYNAAVIDSNGDAWVFGDNGIIIHGEKITNWSIVNSPTDEDILTAYSNDHMTAAAGENGTVIYKEIDSNEWIEKSFDSQTRINSIAINNMNEIIIVTDFGGIQILRGNEWLEINSLTSENLYDITFEDDRGLISGSSGLIMGSEDNGMTWEIRETPEIVSESEIVSIGFYKTNRAYAITSNGQILKSTQEALTTTVGYSWTIKEIESENYNTSLNVNLTSLEILSTTKILLTGDNGYVALSKDGGNIVTSQLLPDSFDNQKINDIAMENAFRGIIVGNNGNIFYTENGGEDEPVGFEVIDLSNFSEFVDFTKDNLWEGLKSTIKIVIFGIFLGFFLGIVLAMCKTAPTTLKQMIESDLEKTLILFWLVMPISILFARDRGIGQGIFTFLTIICITILLDYYINKNKTESEGFLGILIPNNHRNKVIKLLGLSLLIGMPISKEWGFDGGAELIYSALNDFHDFQLGSDTPKLSAQLGYIFAPIGDPNAFFRLIIGIGLTYLGILFFMANGSFSKKTLFAGKLFLLIILWSIILTELFVDFNINNFEFSITNLMKYLLILGLGLFMTRKIIPEFSRTGFELNKYNITIDPWSLRPLSSLATLYTDFFRNTPLLVQFMFIHFGVQLGKHIQNIGIDVTDDLTMISSHLGPLDSLFSPMIDYVSESLFGPGKRSYLSAIFALGLNSAAYQCETIRGAIAAIPSGQMEAGRSIGLTYMGTMRLIILPQAIRICIPPLGNEMVNLVLNSSLASVIAYTELTRQGKLVVAITFQIFWTWGMVMIAYFVVTWTLALLLRRLEEKTRIPGLGISGGN
jgi:polar amino acid transport system permease protein